MANPLHNQPKIATIEFPSTSFHYISLVNDWDGFVILSRELNNTIKRIIFSCLSQIRSSYYYVMYILGYCIPLHSQLSLWGWSTMFYPQRNGRLYLLAL